MTLPILIITVFFLTFLVTSMASYWLLGGSDQKKKIMTRLQAIQEVSARKDEETLRLLRKDLERDMPFLRRFAATLPGVPQLRLFIDQAAVAMEVETFLAISVTTGLGVLIVLLLAGFPAPAAVFGCLGAAAIPSIAIYLKRESRFRKFEELFPDAIDQLARAVRAGHAFTSGFELIGRELPDPVGQEFRTTYAQQNLGVPLAVALQNFAARIPLPDVRFFVAAIQIQRESGGNLGEVLDSLSYVVRERFKLLRQIRVYTAEGRMSMYVLMAMPFVAGVGVYLVNPGYMMPLFTDPRGHMALLVAAVMQVFGFVIIRRMISIKV